MAGQTTAPRSGWVSAVAVAVMMILAPTAAAAQQSDSVRWCPAPPAAAIRTLAPDDTTLAYVEAPDPLAQGNDLVLIGAPTLLWWPARTRGDSLAFQWRLPGGLRIAPDGSVREVPALPRPYPRSPRVRLVGGRVVAVWGNAGENPAADPDSLFYSELVGDTWSAPQLIAGGGGWRWATPYMSGLLERHDTLFFAAPDDSLGGQTYSLFRRVAGTWRHTRPPLVADAAYVALGLTRSELVVVETGPRMHSDSGTVQRLTAHVSQDGGESWSPGETVFELRDDFMSDPVVVAEDSVIHALWSRGVPHQFASNRLWIATRSNGRWRLATPLDVAEAFSHVRAVSDGAGGVLAALPGQDGHVFLAHWNGRAWCVTRFTTTGFALPNPVALPGRSQVRVIWGEGRMQGSALAPVTLIATVPSCC